MSNNIVNTAEMRVLLEATFRLLKKGTFPYTNPEMVFLSLFVEQLVVNAINSRLEGEKDNTKQAKFVQKNFGLLKLEIQESVALAFQRPMQKLSKETMDYYCVIKLAPLSKSSKDH